MTYLIDIQHEEEPPCPFSDELISQWAITALKQFLKSGEMTIRLVNSTEIQQLNFNYRNKNKATNVLSFPSELPKNIALAIPLIGDIIICCEIIEEEAIEQHKTNEAHFAHLVIHGVLHLLGYDHVSASDAAIMEPIEIQLLNTLGIANPYEVIDESAQ